MNRSKDPLLSSAERNFVLEAIKEHKRLDGREVYDYRNVNIKLGSELGNVMVTLGNTRVQACVSCEVTHPKLNRSTEGQLFFNVTLSPMASPSFELGSRSSSLVIETTRMLERCFKESRAIDMESLCIIAGQKVWSIRVDIHVLDYCGNVVDASALAAITALKHFRRPDVTVVGETATIHPVSEREPVPLSIHHIPLCVSFAFCHNGRYLLVDPSTEEELVMDGKLMISINAHQELCALQLSGGVALIPDQVLRCVEIAKVKVSELVCVVKSCFEGSTCLDNSISSVLTTKRNEDIARMEEGDNAQDDLDDESELPETDIIKVLGKDTVQSSVDIQKQNREIEVKDNDNTMVIGTQIEEEMESEEETTLVVSRKEVGGFEVKSSKTRSGDSNDAIEMIDGRGSPKKQKPNKRKKKIKCTK